MPSIEELTEMPELVEARDALVAALERLGDINPLVYTEAERLD